MSLPASSKGTIKCHLFAKHVGGCDAPGVGSGLNTATGAVGVAWRGGPGGGGGVGEGNRVEGRGDEGYRQTNRGGVSEKM